MKIEDRLATVAYKVGYPPHLTLREERICRESCLDRPCTYVCPARTYVWEEDKLVISYENCLECGTCRVTCPEANLVWAYPPGGYGVKYRFG